MGRCHTSCGRPTRQRTQIILDIERHNLFSDGICVNCHIIRSIVCISIGPMYKSKRNISNRISHLFMNPTRQHHARGQFKTTRRHTFWVIFIHITCVYTNRFNFFYNNVLIDLLFRTGCGFFKYDTEAWLTNRFHPRPGRGLSKFYPCPGDRFHFFYIEGVFYLLSVITSCFMRSKYCCSMTPWPAALTWRCCSRCFRWASAS